MVFDNYDIKKYKIGYCEDGLYQHRIIIPSYDDDGVLNYFVGRSYMESGMKYKNPNVSKDVVGFDYFIAWSKPIVCVRVCLMRCQLEQMPFLCLVRNHRENY